LYFFRFFDKMNVVCDGYEENYFADLEKLEEGDVILYQYGEQYKQYQVTRK